MQFGKMYLLEGGLYLPRYNPYGIHLESMESMWNSMWNPWNQCWLRPQPIHCSMDIMDSIWNDHGMVMEWSIPYGIHHYSTWIPLDSIWNVGISTMDSMDKSIWIPWNKSIWISWNSPCGFHGMVHIDDYNSNSYSILTIFK